MRYMQTKIAVKSEVKILFIRVGFGLGSMA